MSLDELENYPLLQQMLDVWHSKCDGGLPRGIDPFEIPLPLLPYVLFMDYLRDPEDLRVRLAGTAVCEKHGGELRGKLTAEVFLPEDAKLVLKTAREVVTSRAPVLAAREDFGAVSWHISYVRLQMPLATTGGEVDRLLNVVDPESLKAYRPGTRVRAFPEG